MALESLRQRWGSLPGDGEWRDMSEALATSAAETTATGPDPNTSICCCLVTKLCLTILQPMDYIACLAPLFTGFSRHEY